MLKKGHNAVFGIFRTKTEVEKAVDALKEEGFRNLDISVLMPSETSTQNFAHEKATKAPEAAATGATGGAVIGGTLGWLAGIGSLAIPGVGPLIAAGPIISAIAGVGVGGTLGALAGALVGMGIPEYEAKRYEGIVKNGGILLSVHVDDAIWSDTAMDVLEDCGAQDISVTGEEHVDADTRTPLKPSKFNNAPHTTDSPPKTH